MKYRNACLCLLDVCIQSHQSMVTKTKSGSDRHWDLYKQKKDRNEMPLGSIHAIPEERQKTKQNKVRQKTKQSCWHGLKG